VRKILLTNDDGIEAPGMLALFDALNGLGEILPVAPQSVQSATSHGVTFRSPLMCTDVTVADRMRGVAVDGRPADCVKLALRAMWQERFGADTQPDLTVSGMNHGANVGVHILYSGTVAAAVESALLGVPAIAVSLQYGDPSKARFGRAARIARTVIDMVLEHPLEGVVNINLPLIESDDTPMPEIRVVGMNPGACVDAFERRQSPDGRTYYWSDADGMTFHHTAAESDVEALMEGCVTVTPLNYVRTDENRLATWRQRFAAAAVATGRS
jgi:5'-nucleotidase